jgi:uncharacterized protein YggT (Ycf19 family)
MLVPTPLPFPIISMLIEYFIGFLIIAMLIRVIVSWVHFGEDSAFVRFLVRVTDPFIEPARRIVGQVAGVLDFSFMLAWFMLIILEVLLIQSLPGGW